MKILAYAYEIPLDLDVRECESQSVPSGYVKIAIEHDHRNSGFSNEKWSFSIAV